MSHLVMFPLLIPLLTGIALVLLTGSFSRVRRAISLAAVLLLVVASLLLLATSADGNVAVYRLGNWPAPFGIVLVADRLAAALG